jgi:hypothetical protein
MVDVEKAIRDYLKVRPELTEYTDARIYAGRDVPPVGYSLPDDGPCVTFRVRGGLADYDDALANPSVQFKCYGSTDYVAMQVYRALYGVLHNGRNGRILHAEAEVLGQSLEEPETHWPFVLTYFTVMVRQED